MASNEFDLVVIGGGPAGIVGATVAAAFGKTVALIDDHPELGGAGANTGTVPSKTLRETALALSGMKTRNLYGVDLSMRREATVADFLRHERSVKAGMDEYLSQRMAAHRTSVYDGTGAFEDPHTIRVPAKKEDNAPEETVLRGEYILIATGSSPAHPPGFPFGCREVYDSDTILELDRIPETMAVIGAGVIGSEYACTFSALGTKVHLIDGRDVFLSFLDAEVSRALSAAMEKNGIVFHRKERVSGYSQDASGKVVLKLVAGDTLAVDAVLMASGRKSNIERLNIAAAGVSTLERGLIPVDECYRTNVPHIFAAGDVIGFPALASTSMEQARHAMRCAFDSESSGQTAKLFPTGVYTIPEVSMVGEAEESLRKSGVDYIVGLAAYRDSSRGRIIGDSDGFLKLIFRRSDMKLLGVHALGEQATEIVHIGMIALQAGLSISAFDEACFNIPTLGTLYKIASLRALKAARNL
jgi:NAD(P) transhydrogenase